MHFYQVPLLTPLIAFFIMHAYVDIGRRKWHRAGTLSFAIVAAVVSPLFYVAP